jgi:hypothetical protein
MAKMKVYGIQVPKKVLGFKLSKGSRKDLRKVLKRLESPEVRTLALSAAGAVIAYLAEHAAQRDGLIGRIASRVSPPAKPN